MVISLLLISVICFPINAYAFVFQQPMPMRTNFWWGSGKFHKSNKTIYPFKIQIPNGAVEDLHTRLDKFLLADRTKPFPGQGFTRGFNGDYLGGVVNYWRNSYNLTKRVEILNQFPQFKTTINGLNIHFLHVRSLKTNLTTLPLLLLHGWPGSVREFYDIIPILTEAHKSFNFTFDVVAPSLPGFGFSDGAAKPGMGPAEMGVVLHNLMQRLGFKKFYIQGGDWGSVIARRMAVLFPKSVLGIHLNMCLTLSTKAHFLSFLGVVNPTLLFPEETKYKNYFDTANLFRESGYFVQQSTKPDTLGLVLSDTPAGLAAYILEKFATWTNIKNMNLFDGGLTEKFTLDALLDNIMIYWITGCITTSMRIYYENLQPSEQNLNLERSDIFVPAACARFENELTWQPKYILRTMFRKLVHVSDISDGGHFAAFELPEALASDIFIAISKMKALDEID